MTRAFKSSIVALVAGLSFGAGLVMSGMAQPRKVLGFLDVFGAWDASLLCVMAGAIAVHAIGYRLVRARPQPLFDARFAVPTRRDIDADLVLGAVLFGIGWGISGYCPGPSVIALASGRPGVLIFVAAMAVGMLVTSWLQKRLSPVKYGAVEDGVKSRQD
jgi:uncharacterized protein